MPSAAPRDPGFPPAVPPPLVTAASLVAVEGSLLLAFGALAPDVATAVPLLAAGAGLEVCAWALWRRRRWGRGPALLAQLAALGLAWHLRAEPTTLLALGLLALAAVVVAGVLHPDSVDLLEQRDGRS